jgi:hypothetical protein
MYPSIKTIEKGLKIERKVAQQIRRIMEGPSHIDGHTRLHRIDVLIGSYGVECIPHGHNLKSPTIYYCNKGDTYAITVLKVNGRFRIGCWGDIVERGKYD